MHLEHRVRDYKFMQPRKFIESDLSRPCIQIILGTVRCAVYAIHYMRDQFAILAKLASVFHATRFGDC